eukprot:1185560-Prorocentrum_minimum.AAC.2
MFAAVGHAAHAAHHLVPQRRQLAGQLAHQVQRQRLRVALFVRPHVRHRLHLRFVNITLGHRDVPEERADRGDGGGGARGRAPRGSPPEERALVGKHRACLSGGGAEEGALPGELRAGAGGEGGRGRRGVREAPH